MRPSEAWTSFSEWVSAPVVPKLAQQPTTKGVKSALPTNMAFGVLVLIRALARAAHAKNPQ